MKLQRITKVIDEPGGIFPRKTTVTLRFVKDDEVPPICIEEEWELIGGPSEGIDIERPCALLNPNPKAPIPVRELYGQQYKLNSVGFICG